MSNMSESSYYSASEDDISEAMSLFLEDSGDEDNINYDLIKDFDPPPLAYQRKEESVRKLYKSHQEIILSFIAKVEKV
jgi:hypothetical protein